MKISAEHTRKVIVVMIAVVAAFLIYRRSPLIAGAFGADGIALNNPGLVKAETEVQYVGEVRPASGIYARFTDGAWGLVALAKVLAAMGLLTGATIRQVITRWANYKGAGVDSYVDYVAEQSGIGPDSPAAGGAVRVVKAVIMRESGSVPYNELQLQNAVNMGLLR